MNIKTTLMATAMIASLGYGVAIKPAHAGLLDEVDLHSSQVQTAKINIVEAIQIVEKDHKGTVTKAALEEYDDKLMYEIEILKNDKETEFYVDAMTGVVSMDDG